MTMALLSVQGGWLVELEVTLFNCRDGAPVQYPECERQVLAAILNQTLASEEAQRAWKAAGGRSLGGRHGRAVVALLLWLLFEMMVVVVV